MFVLQLDKIEVDPAEYPRDDAGNVLAEDGSVLYTLNAEESPAAFYDQNGELYAPLTQSEDGTLQRYIFEDPDVSINDPESVVRNSVLTFCAQLCSLSALQALRSCLYPPARGWMQLIAIPTVPTMPCLPYKSIFLSLVSRSGCRQPAACGWQNMFLNKTPKKAYPFLRCRGSL